MFFGEFERTVDQKGRLTIPSDLLDARLDLDWARVMIMKAETTCLYVYDLATFNGVLAEARRSMDDDDSRLFMHRTLTDAHVAEVDSMKRITLPASLLRHATIEKKAIVVGLFDRIEVWEPAAWAAFLDSYSEVEVPTISDLSRHRIREVS